MLQNYTRIILAVAVGAFLAGCGTIIHGTTQDVSIASSPSGASVTVDGADIGETPITQSLDRGNQHTIELNLDGYESESIIVNKGTSGWVVGNIVFGGLIGLAVDAATGGMYKLTPEQINRSLDEGTAAIDDEDNVFITVVMQPNPDWEKIGELQATR